MHDRRIQGEIENNFRTGNGKGENIMSEISVELGAVAGAIKQCQVAQRDLKAEATKMLQQYNSLGSGWSDDKYRELGKIVHQCASALKRPLSELQRCEVYLQKIQKTISEYNDIHFASDSNAGVISRVNDATQETLLNDSCTSSNGGGTLHFYETTQQTWQRGAGSNTYDSPLETGRTLNSHQGVPVSQGGEGVDGFRGTCGLVSCQNVLRMAGLDVSESDVVNYARSTHAGFLGTRRLCTINSSDADNGGTYASDRQAVLRHFGVDSTIEDGSIDNIARYVAEGRGVIASVEANCFWGRSSNRQEGHAITVTSVERDEYSGSPIGFYVCDSGAGQNCRYVTTSELQEALYGNINVTSQIIR